MPTLSPRSLIEVVMTLMRRRGAPFPTNALSGSALGAAPPCEDVDGLAADLDAAFALRELARRGPDEACLLPRRLLALALDPDEIARLEPALFRDLHWRCTLCESKGECAVDLAGDAVESSDRTDAWQSYCPNAAALRLLGELSCYAGPSK